MFVRYVVTICLSLAASALFATHTLAAMISAPHLKVSPSDPNFDKYPVPITITGGDTLSLVDLSFQVGDGGPALGGTESIRIHSIDYFTGTIFKDIPNQGTFHGENPSLPTNTEHRVVATLVISPQSVAAEGLLATIYLDLTGAALGTRTLDVNASNFSGVYDSSLNALTLNFDNGSLEIVPEPNGVQLALVGIGIGVFFFFVTSRKNQIQQLG